MDNLNINEGDLLGQRHMVKKFLGQGGFGFVTKCCNVETGKMEAIKINKNHPDIFHQAKLEIEILKQLRCLDPATCNIVRWDGFFFHGENICLNFELLDQSLRDFTKDRDNEGLPMRLLRPIIQQLTTALSYLRSMGIVHADLKQDNIMVVDRHQEPLKVKLIDFGLAYPVGGKHGTCVQTLWYRAPEVMLDIPFNEAIDMWSLGVTAFELATGLYLFDGNNEYDVLSMIVDIVGQPSDYLLDLGKWTSYYFHEQSNSHQRWRLKTPEEWEHDTGYRAMAKNESLRCLDDLEELMVGHQNDQPLLVDLIKRMLQLNPDQRIKPQEVLQHPFFANGLPQSSPAADTCIEVDPDQETPDVSQMSSCNQTAGRDSECRVEMSAVYLAAGLDDNAGDVQPETSGESAGWFQRLFGWIKDTYHYYFPSEADQTLSTMV